MNILRQLIKLHRLLFITAILFTFLAIFLNLGWNRFLAELLDLLEYENASYFDHGIWAHVIQELFRTLSPGILIILFLAAGEFLSSYLASRTCEIFAHEMRMGYVKYYLQGNPQMLSELNAGEEQSAMQNELKDISDYLNDNLFSLLKQFVTFVATVIFLLGQNLKLSLLSILPVIPLLIYCSFSSKVIKRYTEQCQSSKKRINGLADVILELFPVIQVYGAYRMVKGTMKANLSEWKHANVKKEQVSARLMSLSGILSFVPLLVLLGFGGYMVINREISKGTFYIFINLSGNVFGFLQNMPAIYAAFRRFEASCDKLEPKLILTQLAAHRKK